MSDCTTCGLPPCTCRCVLSGGRLDVWRGVLASLAAAQLHAELINKVAVGWSVSSPTKFEQVRLRVSLAVMRTEK